MVQYHFWDGDLEKLVDVWMRMGDGENKFPCEDKANNCNFPTNACKMYIITFTTSRRRKCINMCNHIWTTCMKHMPHTHTHTYMHAGYLSKTRFSELGRRAWAHRLYLQVGPSSTAHSPGGRFSTIHLCLTFTVHKYTLITLHPPSINEKSSPTHKCKSHVTQRPLICSHLSHLHAWIHPSFTPPFAALLAFSFVTLNIISKQSRYKIPT